MAVTWEKVGTFSKGDQFSIDLETYTYVFKGNSIYDMTFVDKKGSVVLLKNMLFVIVKDEMPIATGYARFRTSESGTVSITDGGSTIDVFRIPVNKKWELQGIYGAGNTFSIDLEKYTYMFRSEYTGDITYTHPKTTNVILPEKMTRIVTVDPAPEAVGKGTFVTSYSGNVTVVSGQSLYVFRMSLNTPPTLTLTSPSDNQTLSECATVYKSDKTDFLFRILADDQDPEDTLQYTVLLRNVTRTPYTDCAKGVAFDYPIPLSELLMGNNSVQVKVKDNNGAETIRNFTIRRTVPDTLSLKSVYDVMVSFA